MTYGEQTKLTVENMSFSGVTLAQFPEYIVSLIEVKKACAIANYRSGFLDGEIFTRIIDACEKACKLSGESFYPVDVFHGGGGIGINMNINEILAALTEGTADPVDHINLSQSTSDVCHTALRITLFRQTGILESALERLDSCVKEKIEAFQGMDTIARTCWQDGMQVPVNALWKGIHAAIERTLRHMKEIQSMLCHVNLGWTVIGTGTGASDAYREHILPALNEVTGLELCWRESAFDAAQNPDDLVRVSSEISMISSVISKFARDLRLLSSGPECGLQELVVPPVQKGSSFFPGKVNPVIPEMMIQCNFLIQGNHSVIINALEAGEIHLNVWEEMMGFLLMQNLERFTRAVDLFCDKCVSGITCNEEQCRQYSQSSIPLVVRYKDKYGYQEITRQIKEKGLEKFLNDCRKYENETAVHNI